MGIEVHEPTANYVMMSFTRGGQHKPVVASEAPVLGESPFVTVAL